MQKVETCGFLCVIIEGVMALCTKTVYLGMFVAVKYRTDTNTYRVE